MGSGPHRPRGAAVEAAARDALATIGHYLRGEVDGLSASRAIVNDEALREIVPIGLLVDFLGVDAQFGAEPEDEAGGARDPDELAEERAEREQILADERDALTRACSALAAHLERWRRETAPSAGDGPAPPDSRS